MLDPLKQRTLDYREMDSLLLRGGTILGTSKRKRFSAKVGHGEVRAGRALGISLEVSRTHLQLNPSNPNPNFLLNSIQGSRIRWVTAANPGQINGCDYTEGLPIRRNFAGQIHADIKATQVKTGFYKQLPRIDLQSPAAG